MIQNIKKNPTTINIFLFVIAVFLQYNGVFTISLFGSSPSLPLCVLIPLSMFLSETSAFFYGLCLGVVADAFASTTFGFNSIIFSIISLAVCLTSHYLFNNNIRSSVVLVLIFTFIYYLARWFIFYGSVSADQTFHYVVGVALPSTVFSGVVSIAVYYTQKHIFNTSR